MSKHQDIINKLSTAQSMLLRQLYTAFFKEHKGVMDEKYMHEYKVRSIEILAILGLVEQSRGYGKWVNLTPLGFEVCEEVFGLFWFKNLMKAYIRFEKDQAKAEQAKADLALFAYDIRPGSVKIEREEYSGELSASFPRTKINVRRHSLPVERSLLYAISWPGMETIDLKTMDWVIQDMEAARKLAKRFDEYRRYQIAQEGKGG